jgi:hypothetical protein
MLQFFAKGGDAQMSVTITVPDELIEKVKTVVPQPDIEKFFVDAAQKQLREIMMLRVQEEYRRANAHLPRKTPREVYERLLKEVIAFETKYKMSSDHFLPNFESGAIDEDPDDWMAFYRWRGKAYSLRSMEKTYGLRHEDVLHGIQQD